MPSLIEVCVLEIPFPIADVELDTTGSPNVYFTTECSGTGIEDNIKTGLSIYPSPTNDFFTIDSKYFGQHSIVITSLNGQLVYSSIMEGTTMQIDISRYRKGVYFIMVRSKEFIRTEKIIKL